MPRIGDVFFRARVDDSTLDAEAVKAGDKAGAKGGAAMSKSFSSKLKIGKGGVLNDLFSGIKVGAGIAAVSSFTDAVGSTVQVLGEAIKKAQDDEESVNRLGASLKANIVGWQGNTDAIEHAILQSQRLGFTDETLRDSLTVLVGATHDVGKAQEIMATAMDLARFKGIDLRTASEALIKVEGGHYKSLAQLGIKIAKNASTTEALAAVQKVATGQAEAFAKTTSGALLEAQIKIDERMEDLGRVLLPLVAGGLDVVNGALDDVASAFEQAGKLSGPFVDALTFVNGTIGPVIDGVEGLGDSLNRLGDEVPIVGKPLEGLLTLVTLPARPLMFLKDRVDDFANANKEAAAPVNSLADKIAEEEAAASDARESNVLLGTSVIRVGDVSQDTTDDTEALAAAQKDAADKAHLLNYQMQVQQKAFDDAEKAVNDYFDSLDAADALATARHEIAEARRTLASKKATKEQKADARDALRSAQRDRFNALETMAKTGLSLSAGFKKGMKDLLGELGRAHGREKAAINAEILALEKLQAAAFRASQEVAKSESPTNHRASGGPVVAGETYEVGEEGRERLVMYPGGGGYVFPLTTTQKPSYAVPMNAPMASAGGGGGDTYVVNNNVRLEGTPKVVNDPLGVARGLARLTAIGGFGRATNVSPEARK
jgi:hypothetical protein